jgi:hypothetical protein
VLECLNNLVLGFHALLSLNPSAQFIYRKRHRFDKVV